MRYYDVLPLENLPLSAPAKLTYFTEHHLDFGALVSIPVRGRKIRGVVVAEIKDKAKINQKITYKPVDKVLFGNPVMNRCQLQLIEKSAGYYYSSPAKIAQYIVPEAYFEADRPDSENTKRKRRSSSRRMIIGHYFQRLESYLKAIGDKLETGCQILFLTPEISSSQELFDIIAEEFPAVPAGLVNSQTAGQAYAKAYFGALSGKVRIIVGTRMAVWFGFENLGLIIADQEHNSSYKQWDMTPRYDARTIADLRSKIEKCSLLFGSSAPSINAYQSFMISGKIKNHYRSDASFGSFLIADMKAEIAGGNYSIISGTVRIKLRDALADDKQALVCVNKRGTFTFTMCRDCGRIMRCPRCSVPLSGYADTKLRCLQCNYTENMPELCPACSSHRIKGFGLGVERAAIELRKIFPSANIESFDQDTAKSKKSLLDTYQRFDTGQIDILVGTQQILAWHPSNHRLTAFLDIDALLNYPDYNAPWKTYSLILDAHPGRDGHAVIVQTYNPDSPVFSALQNENFSPFYAAEIESRRQAGYPPFTRIIKIVVKSGNEQKARQKAEEAAGRLKNLSGSHSAFLRIVGPSRPIIHKVRDKNIWQIVIFLHQNKNKNPAGSEAFEKILNNMPADWIIDVDPDNIY